MLSKPVRLSESNQTQIIKLQEEITRLRELIATLSGDGEFTHFRTPAQFTAYLLGRTITDGQITVDHICFDASMEGFSAPDSCSKLVFTNCIAHDMARFFHNFRNESSLSTELIDLTGMDMRTCSSLYRSFDHCNCETIKLTPASGPQSLICFALAFYACNSTTVELKNIFSTSTTDLQYSFSSCTASTIDIDSSTNQLSISCNLHAMFYNCKNLTSFDCHCLTSDYWKAIYPLNVESMFQSAYNLTTLDISTISDMYLHTISAFCLGDNNLTTIVVKSSLIDTKCFTDGDRSTNSLITQSDLSSLDGKRHSYSGSLPAELDLDANSYKQWSITKSGTTTKYYSRAAYLVFDSSREFYNPKYGTKNYNIYVVSTSREIQSFSYANNTFTITMTDATYPTVDG